MTRPENYQFYTPEQLNPRHIVMGIAASNVANEINPTFPLPQKLDSLTQFLGNKHIGLELQLENKDRWDIPHPPKSAFLGVHQPTQNIDFRDPETMTHSLGVLQNIMEMTQTIDADYMVLHLETRDKWDNLEKRGEHIEEGKKWFQQVAQIHEDKGYSFKLLAEGLEYPKFPATKNEILDMASFIRELREEEGMKHVGFALDVAHLWRSGSLIESNMEKEGVQVTADEWSRGEVAFSDYLTSTLGEVEDVLELIHITSARNNNGHVNTHLLPGAMVKNEEVILLSRDYSANELDVASAMKIITNFAAKRTAPLPIINEAHGHSYEEMATNCEELQKVGEV